MRGFTYLDEVAGFDGISPDFAAAVERPLTDAQCRKSALWMKREFGDVLDRACAGTPFSAPLLTAMVCQETAYFWLQFIDGTDSRTLLKRCVLDASGDAPGAPRTARPVNTAAFRRDFGDSFTQMLIDEANATRAMRGFGPKQWVYKGYGIFQFDLQFVYESAEVGFYRDKRWYEFDVCLAHALNELKRKYAITHDLWEAVRAYNGSGIWAERYRDNVKHFHHICAEVWQTAAPSPAPQPPPPPPPVMQPSPQPSPVPQPAPHPAPQPAPQPAPAQGGQMRATVISETLNYRSEPKLGNNVLGHFVKGDTVALTGSAPGAARWAVLSHNGQTVYAARRYLAQKLDIPFAPLAADIETLVSDIIWDVTRKYDGIHYRLGCKCSRQGLDKLVFSGTDIAGAACSGQTVDCSGWMHGLFQLVAANVNEKTNREVFTRLAVSRLSDHSDGQIVSAGTMTKAVVSGTDIDAMELRNGMLFGLNNADYDWEGQDRVFEIDHIVMGVRRANGYFIVQSSSSGGGVNTVPWTTWRQSMAPKFESFRVHAVHLMGTGNWTAQVRGDYESAQDRSMDVDQAPFSAPPG